MSAPGRIASHANPLVVRLRRLAQDGTAYRRIGQLWLEGEHLCAAARARGRGVALAVVDEAAWDDAGLRALAAWAPRTVLLPASLFRTVSGLESPARIGFVLDTPVAPPIDARAPSVVLDRLQDAGNVGSILRSAAAFGVRQVIALAGTAALWSPKVLRAGMGAHFALRLVEGLDEAALGALELPLVATGSHAAASIVEAPLPRPCVWVLGHEGQGVSPALQARCALHLRIPQPGGEESLNVAAAAAVCFYEALRRDRTAAAGERGGAPTG
jgi:TrmH family RNA methyltransferase